LLKKITRIANGIAFRLRSALRIKQRHRIGKSTVILPSDHLLSAYQEAYKQYDRFLPHLVKYLDDNSSVIDVGANVGDTVAAMVASNAKLRYVCIEADDDFFDYLVRNTKQLTQDNAGVVIDSYKCLVGLSVQGVKLFGVGGTKHAENSNDAEVLTSRPLDDLISEIGCAPISLIKSDVDGYDYDVIDSAENSISESNCLLYFECYYENESQFDGYKSCLNRIGALGYDRFAIFDNFGALVASAVEREIVFELMNYVRRQNNGSSVRTIHYLDVLAYKPVHNSLVSSVLSDY
jgi:FkbM family methyltransferase